MKISLLMLITTLSIFAQGNRDEIIATDATIDSIVVAEIEKFGPEADLNHINVSAVTDMSGLFERSN
ncbi:MAG: hypothetical protein ACQEQ4_06970, partial [Fibrobacterota bacterium]